LNRGGSWGRLRGWMEHATSAGAEIAYYIIGVALFAAAFFSGRWVAARTRRLWAGWATGIAFVIIAGLLVGPLLNSLKTARCSQDADPSLCYSGYGGQEY
jgi:hypothetical protein